MSVWKTALDRIRRLQKSASFRKDRKFYGYCLTEMRENRYNEVSIQRVSQTPNGGKT